MTPYVEKKAHFNCAFAEVLMTHLFAALSNGLLFLQGQPGHWQEERALEGLPTQCLAADPLQPERLYCGTFGQGMWVSTDAGHSWRPAGAGINSPQIMAVAVSKNERAGNL